jgi:hypothetical protein
VSEVQARQGGMQAFRVGRGMQMDATSAVRQVAGQASRLTGYGIRDVDQARAIADG